MQSCTQHTGETGFTPGESDSRTRRSCHRGMLECQHQHLLCPGIESNQLDAVCPSMTLITIVYKALGRLKVLFYCILCVYCDGHLKPKP